MQALAKVVVTKITITFRSGWRLFRNGWRLYLAILTPLALLPLALKEDDVIMEGAISRPATKYKTAYVILMMSVYWLFEVVPLPVTALLPILFFPLLGIRSAYIVTQTYTQESNMIFLTGAIIALGLEYCNLHRRIALRTMLIFGASPTRLLFGIMAITGFLAMWMSSTTCVSMLVPIVVAIIDEIDDTPEVMTSKRLKSMSRASAAFPDESPVTILRRFSSASANAHITQDPANSNNYFHFRKHSTFENPDLVRSGVGRKKSSALERRYTLHQIPSITNPLAEPRQSLGYTNPPKPKQLAKVKALLQDEGPSPHHSGYSGTNSTTTTTNSRSPYESHAHALRDVESGSLSELRKVSTPHLLEIEIISPEEVMKEEAAVDKRRDEIKKLFLFAMAYASNIGGTAILTTAGPNKILKENLKLIDVDQDGKYKKLTFYTWFSLNLPIMIINLLVAWIYLSIQYNGLPCLSKVFRRKSENDQEKEVYTWKTKLVNALIRDEHKKLGKVCFHQVAVGLIFLLVVMLWIFRESSDTVGWSKEITDTSTGDSTAAMVGVMLLFIIPKDWAFLKDGKKEYEPLLDWKFVAAKMPWGALLLLGSGFAVADAVTYSGLSEAMGERLLTIGQEFTKTTLLLTVIIFATSITEITSNVASAAIIIPIILSLSASLDLHPLFLTIPATVACSYSFMLPGAAPSNAMVFAAGNFKMHEMIKNGFFMNILCTGVLFGITATYGEYLFHFSDYEYPESES